MIISLLIDWDNDGDFLDAGEDVTSRLLALHVERGKDEARIVSPPMAGRLASQLNNVSRDYSLENTGSPLWGNLEPGRRIRVNIGGYVYLTDEDGNYITDQNGNKIIVSGAAAAPLWTGITDDLLQDPALGQQTVQVPSLGTLSWLRGKSVSTALYQNIRTNIALGYLLDAIGFPAADRVFSTCETILDWWWVDNEDAFEAMLQLLYTEGAGAAIYEDEYGRVVFENRNYRMTQTRSIVSQATYIAGATLTEFEYSPDFKDVINACVITINRRQPQAVQKIWELGSRLILGPNEVKSFIIRANDPFLGAIIPSSAPSNASQTLTPSETLTSGTFKLRFRGATTGALQYNSTAAQIQTALEGLSTIGTGNVVCSDGPINTGPVSVAFLASLGGVAIEDLIEVVESSLNPISVHADIEGSRYQESDGYFFLEQQMLSPSGVLTGGTFDVSLHQNGGTIDSASGLAYNATAAAIQTAFGAGPVISVYGGPINTNPVIIKLPVGTGYENPMITGHNLTMLAPSAFIVATQGAQGGIPDYTQIAGLLLNKTLDRLSGQSCKLELTAGSAGVTLDGLQLRARPVTIVATEDVENAMTAALTASQAKWGKRLANVPIREELPRATAQVLANGFADFYKRPRASAIIRSNNALIPEAQLFARQISDRVTIQEPHTGVNQDFYIERVAHGWETPDILCTEFACEKAHADGHSDTHGDAAHGDAGHTDTHSDTAHTDTHTDTHSDAAHADGGHADDHTDIAHVDTHGDAGHGDIAHVDGHLDTAHVDDHTDVAHSDVAHGDDHTDAAHGDTHSDDAHGDNHTDDAFQDSHTDEHSDLTSFDPPFHSDEHMDDHADSAHGDTHSDSIHADAHTDDAHGDVAHSDDAHGDSHTDAHSDEIHEDAHGDDHTDVAHTDAHTDTHTDAHTDAAHSDSQHADDHQDIAHADAAHADDHTDTAHADTAHSDAHSDGHSDSP